MEGGRVSKRNRRDEKIKERKAREDRRIEGRDKRVVEKKYRRKDGRWDKKKDA